MLEVPNWKSPVVIRTIQLTFTCLKSITETLEKSVKFDKTNEKLFKEEVYKDKITKSVGCRSKLYLYKLYDRGCEKQK